MSVKILHRIYFGFDGKPDLYSEYLETWKEQLPEYEIMHWNADNLPMDINDFVKRMYESREHAFLSDYFRWWVLKEYGGIYLDGDIEITNGKLFNEIIEDFEKSDNHSLIGIDTDDGYYTAHSMVCKKNASLAEFMCDIYQNLGYLYHWRKSFCTAPQLVSLYFMENHNDFIEPNQYLNALGRTNPQTIVDIAGVRILPQVYMSPLKYFDINGLSTFYLRDYDPNRTILCHHYGCSWHTPDSPYYNKNVDTLNSRKMLNHYKGTIVPPTTLGKLKQKIKQVIIDKGLESEFNQFKGNRILQFIITILRVIIDFYRFIRFSSKFILSRKIK